MWTFYSRYKDTNIVMSLYLAAAVHEIMSSYHVNLWQIKLCAQYMK